MKDAEDLSEFCRALPKIELHAHLNGSIRLSTLEELCCLKHGNSPDTAAAHIFAPLRHGHDGLECAVTRSSHEPLARYFRMFHLIHEVTTELAVISRITEEVVEDFADENVRYLELRTTPKNRHEHGITKHSYMDAVLRGLDNFYSAERRRNGGDATPIDVRVLLSVDRRESAQEAQETAALALALAKGHSLGFRIVGLDLAGNPTLGSWEQWMAAFNTARAGGLKVTLHCAEIWNEAEAGAMLAWSPDRLGHMVRVSPALREMLLETKIPVEICLTSNMRTQSVAQYEDHHFRGLYDAGHAVLLCTDDRGVFDCTLSSEFEVAATAFGLSKQQLRELAAAAADAAFLPKEERVALRRRMEREMNIVDVKLPQPSQ